MVPNESCLSRNIIRKERWLCVQILTKHLFLFRPLKKLRGHPKFEDQGPKSGPLKNCEGPSKISYKGPKWPLNIFAYFNPWSQHTLKIHISVLQSHFFYRQAFSGHLRMLEAFKLCITSVLEEGSTSHLEYFQRTIKPFINL